MSNQVIDIYQSVNGIMANGHFIFTSGRHSSVYVSKDALYPHTQLTSQIGRMMAEKCSHLNMDTVAAPALGGIILSQWVGYHLTQIKEQEVNSVYAEKDGKGGFEFTRGYDKFIKDKKVLAVEDLTTTGNSVKKVVKVIEEYGGEVVGVCVIINRNPDRVNTKMFDLPFFELAVFEAEDYSEDEAPAELMAQPINTEFGHGKEYLAKKKRGK